MFSKNKTQQGRILTEGKALIILGSYKCQLLILCRVDGVGA
jgi:hypothetical protein